MIGIELIGTHLTPNKTRIWSKGKAASEARAHKGPLGEEAAVFTPYSHDNVARSSQTHGVCSAFSHWI